jgi:hypothetical protein
MAYLLSEAASAEKSMVLVGGGALLPSCYVQSSSGPETNSLPAIRQELTYATLNSPLIIPAFASNLNMAQKFPTAPTSSLQRNIGNDNAMIDGTILQNNMMPLASNEYYFSQQATPYYNFSSSGHYHDASWSIDLTTGEDGIPSPIAEVGSGNQLAPRFAKTCKWEGCKFERSFGREAELLRHIRTTHISPGLYACPEAGCRKSCSRKDNLQAHRRRAHENSK